MPKTLNKPDVSFSDYLYSAYFTYSGLYKMHQTYFSKKTIAAWCSRSIYSSVKTQILCAINESSVLGIFPGRGIRRL